MNDEFGSFSYGDEKAEEKKNGQGAQYEQPKQKRWTPEPYREQVYNAPNYVRTDYSRQDYLKPSESRVQAQHTSQPQSAYTPAGQTSMQQPTMNRFAEIRQMQQQPFSGQQQAPGMNPPTVEPPRNTPSNGSSPERKKDRNGDSFGKKMLRTAALGLVFGLVGGAAFLGLNRAGFFDKSEDKKEETTQSSTAVPGTTGKTGTDGTAVKQQGTVNTGGSSTTVNYDVAEIVKKAQPSIVSITTKVKTQYQYFYQQFEQESTGAGSGIIIATSPDNKTLYIATNYHVIEGATEINVGFNDGQIIKARVTGTDKSNDVAVVEIPMSDIPESTQQAISVAAVGDSDQLQVGEPAIAIGNALGYGQSVTVGYISALNRSISNGEGSYIQTDAAINPGNSGGALINSKGEVIGINSVKYVDSKVEGMGFSIPINRATKIIDNLISGKTSGKVFIGISGATIDSEYSQIYGFPQGAYVKTVNSGSPAENAGIHEGDILVAIEGKETLSMESFIETLQDYKAGSDVKITLYRANSTGQYEKMTVTVTTAEE